MTSQFPPAPDGPICWYDGMLLTEQHFESLDQRHEQLLAYAAQAANPYFWGVRTLRVEAEHIALGTFVLSGVEAILPSGLVVVLRNRRELDLKSHVGQLVAGGPCLVCLEPHREPEGESNFTGELDEEKVQRKEPAVRLWVHRTVPEGALPLARLTYKGNNEFEYDRRYIPPTSFVPRGHALHDECLREAKTLRQRAYEAIAQARKADTEVDKRLRELGLTGGLVDARLKAMGLTAGLYQLEAVLHSDVAHPFSLYAALCQVAGLVTGAALPDELTAFEPYNHLDLRSSFQRAFEAIDTGLQKWPAGYEGHPFQWDAAACCFSIQLDESWLPTTTHSEWPVLKIEGRADVGVEREALSDWLAHAVIAVAPKMEIARKTRILGVDRALAEPGLRLGSDPTGRAVLLSLKVRPQDEFVFHPDSKILQVL